MQIPNIESYQESKRSGVQLISETEKNYRVAQAYFFQKKMAFLKAICNKTNSDIGKVEEGLVKSMNNLIQQVWDKTINQPIMENIDILNKRSGKYVVHNVTTSKWQSVPKAIRDEVISGSGTNQNIYSMLGFDYEDWLTEALKKKSWMVADKSVQAVLGDFLSKFDATGKITTSSALRENGKNIRPDLAIGINKDTAADKNGLTAELQVAFDIQNYRKANGLIRSEQISNDINILQEYINSDMFGFSVKRWTSDLYSKEKELTQASGVAKIITNTYKKSGHHTWNALYAYRTMTHIISRFLLDILGPVNVAFITGNQFEWTNDFLSDALLTMHLYAQTYKFNDEKSIYEIKPYVNSNNIYVQRYKRGRQLALLQQNLSSTPFTEMSGKGWHAYQFNFSIQNKK